MRRINEEINCYGAGNVILNPTAGFKALVPYTVLLGMLKSVRCQYIFDQSTALLDLPPFPVEFRRSQFEIYRTLFEQVERESSISIDAWKAQVPQPERELLEPLIEMVEDQVTLSGVGFLFLEEIRSPSVLVPFLSQKAIEDCFKNLLPLDNCDPFRFLKRVAGDRNALQKAEHINLGNGLRWLKPGRTTDRYLVSVEGWHLLVWRAIREDQVGTTYPNQIKINPKTERRTYSPFVRMDYYVE